MGPAETRRNLVRRRGERLDDDGLRLSPSSSVSLMPVALPAHMPATELSVTVAVTPPRPTAVHQHAGRGARWHVDRGLQRDRRVGSVIPPACPISCCRARSRLGRRCASRAVPDRLLMLGSSASAYSSGGWRSPATARCRRATRPAKSRMRRRTRHGSRTACLHGNDGRYREERPPTRSGRDGHRNLFQPGRRRLTCHRRS